MKNPFKNITEKVSVYGKMLGGKAEQSSLVGGARRGSLSSANLNRILPRIEFWRRQEFYLTVGRVQNVAESYVLNIINREWYYDDTSDEGKPGEGKHQDAVELMEQWEEDIVVTRFISNMVRNWIVNGVHIISPKDWLPLQLQSLIAKQRDQFGHTTFYIQQINGVEHKLDANDFIEVPYIEWDREPWPVGMFDSLMNSEYIDIDGRDPKASLELYRQALQDNMKIHHKFASPRVIYTAEGVGKETIDNDITPIIEGMLPGDRAVFNTAIEIKQETVDGTARFVEHLNKIIDEIDTGLQSSSNRLITEPSAMADAREAGAQDDDRTLGIMERVRIFMNKEVIPRITGLPAGTVVFKWGAKDTFDIDFPEPIEKAINLRIITPETARKMLEDQYRWKIPDEDEVMADLGLTPEEPDDTTPRQPEVPPEVAEAKLAREKTQIEKIKAEQALIEKKMGYIDNLNKKIEEV